MKLADLTGQRFGRLVVLSRAPNEGRRTVWNCRCDCGVEKPVKAEALSCGDTQSCGCLKIEKARKRIKHGRSKSAIYRTWSHMLGRCRTPTDNAYKYYGGRGITVCDRWLDFETFAADMGDPPEGLTLDRIDNDKGYEPGNCRWADKRTQAQNRRWAYEIQHEGEILTMPEFARRTNRCAKTLRAKIARRNLRQSVIVGEDLLRDNRKSR